MKILGVTMGSSLQVFLGLLEALRERIPLDTPVAFVADTENFRRVARDHPALSELVVLKEWDLVNAGVASCADRSRIAAYEQRLNDNLWNALLADRRIFFGRMCKSRQDYAPRFTYEQLLAVLDSFLTSIDAFLDKTRPDLVLSFGTATLGDYLFELFAREKRISYLQLKSTKIRNRVALNETGIDIPASFEARYRSGIFDDAIVSEAKDVLESIRSRGVRYEGAILFSRGRMLRRLFEAPVRLAAAAQRSLRNHFDPLVAQDNHLPPPFRTALYTHVLHPVRTFRLGKTLPFLRIDDLESRQPFLFYPLHFEPEVSLQVFGRSYQNQIEAVRALALSVPMNMRVIVKEHPRSLGFRKSSYYRKLLDIPNVSLADPFLPALQIVRRASIVAVVSGSIGFEAAVCAKPVVVLGRVPYQILPPTMVRRIVEPDSLAFHISDLLAKYSYSPEALVRYVCAILEDSTPADLYTALLGKSGRHSGSDERITQEAARRDGYRQVSAYLLRKLGQVRSPERVN